MIYYTNIICMRIPWTYDSHTSFWLLSIVARLVPIVNRSATRLLEEIKPPFLSVTDIIPEEKKVEVTAKDMSTPTKAPTLNSNTINWVRLWSVEYILEVAQKLTHAVALLRTDQYSKASQHIEKYIANISSADPQYALVALWDLKERLDVFLWASTSKKLNDATHLYAPPSEWVYAWFRDSQYIGAQRWYIKELNARKYILPLLTRNDALIAKALSHIADVSNEIEQELHAMQWDLQALAETVSYNTIYTKYFGKLDDNIISILCKWDMLDPLLGTMVAEYFKWKKEISVEQISPELEELLYINLIYWNKTPNPPK